MITTRIRCVAEGIATFGAALALTFGQLAVADDTEVFLGTADQSGLRPNILFILDTSGSMNSLLELPRAPYDPSVTYAGACDPTRIYYSTNAAADGSPAVPLCAGNVIDYVNATANKCQAAAIALASNAGLYTGRVLQRSALIPQWVTIAPGALDQPLECAADAGIHGATDNSGDTYARNGDPNHPWTSNPNERISWDSAPVVTLYSANELNWYYAPAVPARLTRLQTMQSVASSILNSIDGVNVGLMRFSNAASATNPLDLAEGGMVTHEIANITTARSSLIADLQSYTAQGFTPLSETLYEAGLYFAGRKVDYGLNSRIDDVTPFPSVSASRQPANPVLYQSPIQYQCQRNYDIILTDGEPSMDSSADAKIASLPGFNSLVGASCDGSGDGHCLDDMAQYLHDADLSPLTGKQSVTTYTIGFGPDVAGSAYLETVARRGGGRAYTAGNVTELTAALQSIVGDIQRSSATFASPTISVNAFNRSFTNNNLYISVFNPTNSLRWPGNVKKYGLRNGQIVDASGSNAIDPATGFFLSTAQSYWSPSVDGADVTAGGAVSRMPTLDSRHLYTWFPSAGVNDLSSATNALSVANPLLTDAILNTSPIGAITKQNLLDWFRGRDLQDLNGNGNVNEVVTHMGDPLHAKPAIVTYGGSVGSPDALDSVLYVPTNDGFLHAIDAKTGRELWAFVPPSLLGRLADIYTNRGVTARSYGLDGEVRVLTFDANQDGVIDAAAGDRVWIYFGMRRGGREYFALDVTDRLHPQIKFDIGPGQLPGVGETWSTPTIARVRIAGAPQNGENLVLIFGGGYDDAEENGAYVEDSSGHRIYIVDASSGALLWYAGGPRGAGNPDLPLDRMRNAIPSRVVVLDTNNDGYADRMYVGDLGGRVWRFDITNGNSRANLVAGGVIAALGAGDNADQSMANNRRFYNAPDVALIQHRGVDPYFSIAIGSGYRGHPLNTVTQDRFYLIRDKSPFASLSAASYAGITPLNDATLVNITGAIGSIHVPAAAAGWKLEMRLHGGWVGEKILNDALTVNGTVLFTSYQPQATGDVNACQPANGINRAYAVSVDDGHATLDFNHDGVINASDVSQTLMQSGIAGEVNLALEAPAPDHSNNAAGTDALGRRALCVVGVEVLQRCVAPGGIVRTFWEHRGGTSE